MTTAKHKILSRIRRWGPQAAFTPKDFLDLASRGSVDMALKALAAEGSIRRLGRGIYDLPSHSKIVKGLSAPDLDKIARAIARRYRWTIIPHGPLAANLWGLSTQVPARPVYISDGPSRSFTIEGRRLQFKHARPKETGVTSERTGAVIQALRTFGRKRVDAALIDRLRRNLTAKDKKNLLIDAKQSADWIYAAARKVAGEESA